MGSYQLSTTKKSLCKELDLVLIAITENHDTLKQVIELCTGKEAISIDTDNDIVVYNADDSALDDRQFVGTYLSIQDDSFDEPGRASEIVHYMQEHGEYHDDAPPWQPFEHYDAEQLLSNYY